MIIKGEKVVDTIEDVTLLFADIVGFTAFSSGKTPRQVVEMLSRLFSEFDIEVNKLNLYKLYTIGDCYVVMGFSDKTKRHSPIDEANDVVQLGFKMIEIIEKVGKQVNFEELNMRIGVHTGKVYSGVIGTDLVRFDLYGTDYVIANKMESGGKPGFVNVSSRTKDLLEELDIVNYTFEENKKIYVKSLGSEVQSYFVKRTPTFDEAHKSQETKGKRKSNEFTTK
jgi:class 3 adenylate cyclase